MFAVAFVDRPLGASTGLPVRVRMTISRKFFAVLAVLVPLIVAVAVAGVAGLASMKSGFDRVFADNIHASQVSTSVGADLARADVLALRLADGHRSG